MKKKWKYNQNVSLLGRPGCPATSWNNSVLVPDQYKFEKPEPGPVGMFLIV